MRLPAIITKALRRGPAAQSSPEIAAPDPKPSDLRTMMAVVAKGDERFQSLNLHDPRDRHRMIADALIMEGYGKITATPGRPLYWDGAGNRVSSQSEARGMQMADGRSWIKNLHDIWVLLPDGMRPDWFAPWDPMFVGPRPAEVPAGVKQ